MQISQLNSQLIDFILRGGEGGESKSESCLKIKLI